MLVLLGHIMRLQCESKHDEWFDESQENALLREQRAEAERRSCAAELRERIDSHKQVNFY